MSFEYPALIEPYQSPNDASRMIVDETETLNEASANPRLWYPAFYWYDVRYDGIYHF